MSRKKFTNADPTADKAIGNIDQDKQRAAEQQHLERLRVAAIEARNERIRRARELAQGGDGGDAA